MDPLFRDPSEPCMFSVNLPQYSTFLLSEPTGPKQEAQ